MKTRHKITLQTGDELVRSGLSKERDAYAVPLRTGGYGIAVVCRVSSNGMMVLRFFGPRFEGPPNSDALIGLNPEHAIAIGRVGIVGIKAGTWLLVGQIEPWEREKWGNTRFIRYEQLTGRTYEVQYDDTDPAKMLWEETVSPGEAEQGPPDGLMGSGYAEMMFTRLLNSTSS